MNYYNRLKDLYYTDYKYDSANLFNDNFNFMLKNFGPSLLLLALFLTIIPLIPLLPTLMNSSPHEIVEMGILDSTKFLDKPDMINNGANIITYGLVTIASFLVLSYFIMNYFTRARETSLSWSKSFSIFKSGLLKLLGIMLMGMVVSLVLSLFLFIFFFLGHLAILLYTLAIMLLMIFLEIFQVSIFDDARVKFGLVYERTMDVIRNKGFKFKFFFIMVLNLLVPWTMDSIVLILPEKTHFYGILISNYLKNLYSLFMLGFLITVFIFYSEHVKFYLNPEAARDYGYDPIENKDLDHEE